MWLIEELKVHMSNPHLDLPIVRYHRYNLIVWETTKSVGLVPTACPPTKVNKEPNKEKGETLT